jgi:hypothetical protein
MNQPFADNWFRYGYNNNVNQTKRISSSDKFFVDFDVYSPNYVLPAREAFRFNNATIQENANGSEIFVMLSGGYDSQSIAKTMVEDNVKFTALIFDFGKDMNQFDVMFAKQICNQYKVSYKIVSFDLAEFYRSGEYKEYAEITHCNYQYNLAYMRGLRDINGVVVSGHGDQSIKINENGKFWNFEEQIFSLITYGRYKKLDNFIRYHAYTKEIWYSVYDHCWKNLNLSGNDEHYKIKNKFFTSFGLEERPKNSGFEFYVGNKFQPIRYQAHKYLLNRYPSSQNDVENIYKGEVTGDLVLVKVP